MTKTILHYVLQKCREMNNEEIRYRILKALYDRYYNVEPDRYVPFDDVIKEAELENEEKNSVDANIEYLKNDYYIEKLGRSSQTIAMALKLETSGIDFVEDRNSEYRDYHGKLRFKILSSLYEFFFEGNTGRFADTLELVNEVAENENEKKLLLAETLYLGDRGYIKPLRTTGYYYPPGTMIENRGIDVVDSIVEQSVEELENADIDEDTQIIVSKLKLEKNKKTRLEKFRKLLPAPGEVTKPIIVETIKHVITRVLSGDIGNISLGGN